jgi:cyanophycinase
MWSTWRGPFLALVACGAGLVGSARAQDGLKREKDGKAQEERDIGVIVLIGGHEDTKGGEAILRRFVKLAGGDDARIAVVTVAAPRPEEMVEKYKDAFGRIGVKDLRFVDARCRDEADSAANLEAVERATGVFFTGGDQQKLVDVVRNSKLDRPMHRRHLEGQVIAGTSAGAAMMSEMMADGGEGESSPRAGLVELGHGLDFLPGVFVDSHFAQRGRLGRLLTVVSVRPQSIAIGIDEDTALIAKGHERCEVIGTGVVTVVDTSRRTYNNREGRKDGEPIALFGLTLHILPEGCLLDLRNVAPSDSNDPKRIESVR